MCSGRRPRRHGNGSRWSMALKARETRPELLNKTGFVPSNHPAAFEQGLANSFRGRRRQGIGSNILDRLHGSQISDTEIRA
jgi:hypothetical protein